MGTTAGRFTQLASCSSTHLSSRGGRPLEVPMRGLTMVNDGALLWNLSRYRAPLFNKGCLGTTLSVEETLAQALNLARRRPDVARVWPLVYVRNRDWVDLALLTKHAQDVDALRVLGFYTSLLVLFLEDPQLVELESQLLRTLSLEQEMEYFFPDPESARLLVLERKRTPLVAKKWGFWMNATVEWFYGCFMKHGALDVSV